MSSPDRRSSRPGLRHVAALVLLAGLGGVVGALAARWTGSGGGRLGLSGLEVAAVVGVALLVIPLLVLWHELGHVAAGRVVGFRPVLLVVGPVRWQGGEGRWRMSANRSAALAGGLAVCVPRDGRDLPRRTAVMIGGGPLASLLGGALGLAAWAALPPLHGGSALATVVLSTALAVFGFGNLVLAAAALAPTRAGGFYSDGARLLRLRRPGSERDREAALLLLTGASIGGVRPRDWSPELVERAVGEADGSLFHVGGLQMAYAHALDRGDLPAARARLSAMLEADRVLHPVVRPALRLAAAYFAARHEGDAARARELVAGAEGGLLVDRHIRHVARAAAAWAAGDADTAAAELDRAEAEIPRAVDRGAAAAAADQAAELRALLRDAPAGVADVTLAADAGPG